MRTLLLTATLALSTTILCADVIPVANPSFETATLAFNAGNGPFSQIIPGSSIFTTGGTLADWTATASNDQFAAAGAFDPNLSGINWTSKWWDGNNVGYVQIEDVGTVALSQVLTTNLLDNTQYTLTVDVGRRGFTPAFNYAIQLWADGSLLGSASNLNLAGDSFGTDSLTVSTGASNAEAGKPIEIVLSSTYSGGFTEAFFDNVQLNAVTSSVPEPRTLVLLLAGLSLVCAAKLVPVLRRKIAN
jgi:hypothetical protein